MLSNSKKRRIINVCLCPYLLYVCLSKTACLVLVVDVDHEIDSASILLINYALIQ